MAGSGKVDDEHTHILIPKETVTTACVIILTESQLIFLAGSSAADAQLKSLLFIVAENFSPKARVTALMKNEYQKVYNFAYSNLDANKFFYIHLKNC